MKTSIFIESICESQILEHGEKLALIVQAEGKLISLEIDQTNIMPLLLELLRARSACVYKNPDNAGNVSGIIDSIACKYWEIRTSIDRKSLFFCFLATNDGWLKIQLGSEVSAAIRETLESFESIERFKIDDKRKN